MTSQGPTDVPEIRTGQDLSTELTRGILAMWAREGKWAEITVAGVSMTPLIPDRSTLTVRFGRQGLAVGDVVLYAAPGRIIAHRVLRMGRGGRRWGCLKVKGDPLRHGEASWIPVEDVVGRVVAVRRPDGKCLLLNDALGRLGNRAAALISGLPALAEGKLRALIGAAKPLSLTPTLLGALHPLYLWGGRKPGRDVSVLLGDEERFLLAAGRLRMREKDIRRVSALLCREILWERVTGAASSLGLAPLLFRNLGRPELREKVPEAAMAALGRSAHAAACRVAIQLGALDRILSALRRGGVDPVLLKGAALAITLHDQPALRPMQDIDLLVEDGQKENAVRILSELGFRGVVNSLTDAFYASHHHARPQADRGGRVIVEIHTGLVPPEDGLSLDPRPFLDRAVRIEVKGHPYRILSKEDQLVHAALHLSYADRFIGRIRDLMDVHALVDRADRAMDWGRVLDAARSPEVSRSLFSSLDLSRRLLGSPVPPAVIHEMARGTGWDPLARGLVRALARSSLFRASSSDKLLSAPAARWMCDALIKRSGWLDRGKDLFELLQAPGQIAA